MIERNEKMKNNLIKTLILIICLTFTGSVFAEVEEEVIVVTNVPYTATLTKRPSTESGTINPVNGTHPGLASVFTLQTNGGDDYFEYIISSYIDTSEGRTSGYGDDGRLLFAHTITQPDLTAYENAKSGSGQSKNIFAYPTSLSLTGGRTYDFKLNYKEYGNCYAIYAGSSENPGDITHTVSGTPSTNTYESGLDEAGTYKSTIVFTVASK